MPERPDSDREVLTSLPRSRPVRRSAKRGDRPAADGAASASSKPVAPRKPRAAKAAPQIQLVVALLLVPSVLLLVAAALVPALLR